MASCIEALDPIGIDLDKFIHATDFKDRINDYGHVLIDTASMIEICQSIPNSDK